MFRSTSIHYIKAVPLANQNRLKQSNEPTTSGSNCMRCNEARVKTRESKSAFLMHGNAGRSDGTTNGTVLPTGNFSEKKKESLQMYTSFLVFTEMTGISLNHLPHHTRTMLFHKSARSVAPKPGETCTVPFV